jgi:hypothetical protein
MPKGKMEWWGQPDLNGRPLPKSRAGRFFTGFFMTAPELRHTPKGQQTRSVSSGARRHTGLDYDPTTHFSNN